jgi:hypothetical protein
MSNNYNDDNFEIIDNIDKIENNKINKYPSWLIWVGIFLILLIISLSIIYWSLPPEKTPRLTAWLSMVAFVGTAIGVIGFFLAQYSQSRSNREAQLQTALNFIQSNYLQLEQKLTTDPDLFGMYQNMNKGNPLTDQIPAENLKPRDKDQALVKRTQIVAFVIQFIENINSFVITRGLKWSDPQPQLWLRLFRQWFRNEPLFELGWKNYYEQFSDQTTRDLINYYIIGN